MSPGFNMDSSASTGNEKSRGGYHISRKNAFILLFVALGTLIITALIVHHLSSCNSDSDNTGVVETQYPLNIHTSTSKIDVRLPRSVVPERYIVKLIPYLWDKSGNHSNYTFSGTVSILLNITEDTKSITLHAHDLNIRHDATRVEAVEGNTLVEVKKQEKDEPRQFHVIHVSETLKAGKQYELQLTFIGNLNDLLQGFYRSSYKQGGEVKWIATTQFQPTDARRAFPCFDEPGLKARFRISLARPADMIAVSNMPKSPGESQAVENMSGYFWDHFDESVPMSTYLVAFVVSGLSRKEKENFSVWTRRDALSQAEYALSVGPPILKYFESYFQIPFPLPKIDMVALPDFAAGAMENWGLITYRETTMLFEEGVSTSSNKQRVATVVAHELAHQWFGNLVTPAWWTDLWLNEGFASYVEYLGVDAVEPGWKVMDLFVIDEVHNVLALDALETSHPISIEVGHPDEINEIFDRISYGKGASIIRMMDHFLTTKVFTKGLHNYLKSKEFQSATQNDLWGALTEQAHKDGVLETDVTINMIMDTWTLQTGFPVLNVVRDYDTGSAIVTQERFLLNSKSNKTKNATPPLWWVPVTYTTSREKNFSVTKPSIWLRKEPTANISNLPTGNNDWLVLNLQETGFYRVNYDAKNWDLLTKALDSPGFGGIEVVNRAQLMDDALSLARAGQLEYATALGVTRYLSQELDYIPWKAALTALSYIDSMIVKTAAYANFKGYILKKLDRVYNETGLWEKPGEPQLKIYQRVNLLLWTCGLGHIPCVNHSVSIFKQWQKMPNPDASNPVPSNLKNVIYCTAIKHGGQEEWEFAWARYLATNVGSEKDLLLTALGCSRETWLLSRYLLWAVTENSGIRKQDSARVFLSVSNSAIGQTLAFNFLRDEWHRIKNYFGTSLFSVSSMVRSATRRLHSSRELDDLRQFAAQRRSELGTANRAVDQAIERAEANVRWMEKNAVVIDKWLTEEMKKTDNSETSTISGR